MICQRWDNYYNDVIMSAMALWNQMLTIVYSTVYSGADPSSASLAFVRWIHRSPVNSPHKGPVTRIFFSIWWLHYDWLNVARPNVASITAIAAVEVWEWDKYFHPTFYRACDYLYILGLKLIHINERGLSWHQNSLSMLRWYWLSVARPVRLLLPR